MFFVTPYSQLCKTITESCLLCPSLCGAFFFVCFGFFALNLTYFASCTLIPGGMMPHRYFSSCIQMMYCEGVQCSSAQELWWEL